MDKIEAFINTQREEFNRLDHGIIWANSRWITNNWLPHRGKDHTIDFRTMRSGLPDTPESGVEMPLLMRDFSKAMTVYMQLTRQSGFMATRNYSIELRRLYCLVMFKRNEISPACLTNWHFLELLRIREKSNYKNLYDSAANIKLIADAIDSLGILDRHIDFKHVYKPKISYFKPIKLTEITDDLERDESKLPSMELFKAYATCTNNPINEYEEILLRTIDLLIAMGQRGNEVTCIPVDCWVERDKYDDEGKLVCDSLGKAVKTYGIRYFAEKQFKPRIHYLSDLDVPFAKRAIDSLIQLTSEQREIASWQEKNTGMIWDFRTDSIDDDSLLEILSFMSPANLHLFLKRFNLTIVKQDQNLNRPKPSNGHRRITKRNWYSTKELNEKLFSKVPDHNDFGVIQNGSKRTVLKTSEILSIAFEGSFRFKGRSANLLKIAPQRISIIQLNHALGANPKYESIFERRGLKEADGSRLRCTTHAFRHWRNTIYQLTGMTDVQQALALGRQDISQNPYYQHTTLKEKTESHSSFLLFNNTPEKIGYLKQGIRSGEIIGPIHELYQKLKKEQNSKNAEEFLNTHANALHVTPYGGCTHDFSQSPCQKHLQCWNGCSHLHRTNSSQENEKLKVLLKTLEDALINIKKEQNDSSIWVKDLETKIDNIRKALKMKTSEDTVQVFPDGVSMAPLPKISSVKSEDDE